MLFVFRPFGWFRVWALHRVFFTSTGPLAVEFVQQFLGWKFCQSYIAALLAKEPLGVAFGQISKHIRTVTGSAFVYTAATLSTTSSSRKPPHPALPERSARSALRLLYWNTISILVLILYLDSFIGYILCSFIAPAASFPRAAFGRWWTQSPLLCRGPNLSEAWLLRLPKRYESCWLVARAMTAMNDKGRS